MRESRKKGEESTNERFVSVQQRLSSRFRDRSRPVLPHCLSHFATRYCLLAPLQKRHTTQTHREVTRKTQAKTPTTKKALQLSATKRERRKVRARRRTRRRRIQRRRRVRGSGRSRRSWTGRRGRRKGQSDIRSGVSARLGSQVLSVRERVREVEHFSPWSFHCLSVSLSRFGCCAFLSSSSRARVTACCDPPRSLTGSLPSAVSFFLVPVLGLTTTGGPKRMRVGEDPNRPSKASLLGTAPTISRPVASFSLHPRLGFARKPKRVRSRRGPQQNTFGTWALLPLPVSPSASAPRLSNALLSSGACSLASGGTRRAPAREEGSRAEEAERHKAKKDEAAQTGTPKETGKRKGQCGISTRQGRGRR